MSLNANSGLRSAAYSGIDKVTVHDIAFDAGFHLQPFPWQHLVAGAAAGAVSRSATAPLELLRLQAMTGGASVTVHSTGGTAVLKQRPSLLQALQAATGDRGWTGLWRGNGLNVLRAGPQKAIDFFTFELYKVGQYAVLCVRSLLQNLVALVSWFSLICGSQYAQTELHMCSK